MLPPSRAAALPEPPAAVNCLGGVGIDTGDAAAAITGLARAPRRARWGPSLRSWERSCPGWISCTLHLLACKEGGKSSPRPFLAVPTFKAACVGAPHFSACSGHHTAAIQARLGGRVHTAHVNTLTIMAEMYFIVVLVPQFCPHPPKPHLLHLSVFLSFVPSPSLSPRLLLKMCKAFYRVSHLSLDAMFIYQFVHQQQHLQAALSCRQRVTQDVGGKNAK